MPVDHAIEIDSLTKAYRSNKVLDGASLRVDRGKIVAVLGENGAGKTTTIRTLMGFVRPDAGSVKVFGLDVRKHTNDIRRRVGYVSDHPALYEWMTVKEMGWFCAAFYDGAFGDRFEELMAEFDVSLKQRIECLSRGQKARVALSLALAAEPELLIMDEPTSGLDPIVRREFLEKIRQFAVGNRSVLLASHQVEDVERVADAVAILRPNGKFLSASVDELKQQIRELSFAGAKPEFLDGLVVLSESEADGRTKLIVEKPSAEQIASLRNTAGVTNFEEREPGLEEVYFAVLRGSAATN